MKVLECFKVATTLKINVYKFNSYMICSVTIDLLQSCAKTLICVKDMLRVVEKWQFLQIIGIKFYDIQK